MTIEPHVALLILCGAIAVHIAIKKFEKVPVHLDAEWVRWRRRSVVRVFVCTGCALAITVLGTWALGVHPIPGREVPRLLVRPLDSAKDGREGCLNIQLSKRPSSVIATLNVQEIASSRSGTDADLNHWLVRALCDAARRDGWPARGSYQAWAISWPYPCFFAGYTISPQSNGRTTIVRTGELQLPAWVRSVFFAKRRDTPFIVPYFVHWPSFLSNVILFTLPPYVVWTFFASRRFRRRFERGQCLRCGYDASGLAAGAPCPECGLASQVPANQVSSPA